MTQLNSAQAEIKVRLRADLSRVVATLSLGLGVYVRGSEFLMRPALVQ